MTEALEVLGTKSMIYADSIQSISIIGSTARVQLEAIVESKMVGDKKEFRKELIGTVVMPLSALDGLLNMLQQLKAQIKEKKEALTTTPDKS